MPGQDFLGSLPAFAEEDYVFISAVSSPSFQEVHHEGSLQVTAREQMDDKVLGKCFSFGS